LEPAGFAGNSDSVRILVTNDDGIDSTGLHVLALAMREHGEVVVAAPDAEYSGASAALGALHLIRPEVHRVRLDGIDEAWAVTGPPALCVMFARLGAFGGAFDLVVSGINPGANVGRAVYHSGTVGAALTARNGGISGVAVSQSVAGFGVEGQGWDEMLANQQWDTAATVARAVVGALVVDPPGEAVVVNVNVPNLPLDEIKGWRRTEVGTLPPRTMASAVLEPKTGHDDTFHVRMSWGDPLTLPADTDGGAIEQDEVSLTFLGRMLAVDPPAAAAASAALERLFDRV
jgi:5'-nucleotidase